MSSKVLKVQATQMTFVGNKRRKPGQIFQIPARFFSPTCMKLLEGDIPSSVLKRFPKEEKRDKDGKLLKQGFGDYTKVETEEESLDMEGFEDEKPNPDENVVELDGEESKGNAPVGKANSEATTADKESEGEAKPSDQDVI